jgi:hypothetical protein
VFGAYGDVRRGCIYQEGQGDTEELCGTSFSKSLVSELAGSLDSELQAWRNRRLEAGAHPYMLVDARYEKVRMNHKVVREGVLVVSAVWDDGMREILTVEVAGSESQATYNELFRSLRARDLKRVELVVSDAAFWPSWSIETFLPYHSKGTTLALQHGAQEGRDRLELPCRERRRGECPGSLPPTRPRGVAKESHHVSQHEPHRKVQ